MTHKEMVSRESDLRDLLESTKPYWNKLSNELRLRRAQLVEQLVMKDDESIRGGIKELDRISDLPANLSYELKDIVDALSANDAS